MTLDQANQFIKTCADQMNARYNGVVFDEWAIVQFIQQRGQVLAYTGPRRDDFPGLIREECIGRQKSPTAQRGSFALGTKGAHLVRAHSLSGNKAAVC